MGMNAWDRFPAISLRKKRPSFDEPQLTRCLDGFLTGGIWGDVMRCLSKCFRLFPMSLRGKQAAFIFEVADYVLDGGLFY